MGMPTRGTRPGCATVDYLFNIVFAKPLGLVHRSLQAANLVLDLGRYQPEYDMVSKSGDDMNPLVDITFVDDVMIPIVQENDCIIQSVKDAMDDMHASFVAHFMEPNYGRGKTGALFQLRGPNRESLREALYGGEVSLTSDKYGFTFHIERHYKHMGVVVSFDCSWRPEITR
eukprot:1441281-Pyramimonas_sp.AAC.1